MGHSVFSATGGINDYSYPNVLQLSINRSPFGHALAFLASRLPRFLQRTISFIWPSLLLPDRIVVKKLKRDWDEEFENERNVYKRLKALKATLYYISMAMQYAKEALP